MSQYVVNCNYFVRKIIERDCEEQKKQSKIRISKAANTGLDAEKLNFGK